MVEVVTVDGHGRTRGTAGGAPPLDPVVQAQHERQDTRLLAAVRAGWLFRFDPVRLEYTAARELHVSKDLDALLDALGVPR